MPLEAPVTTAMRAHDATIACSGNGARSFSNRGVASTRSSQAAIAVVLARVGAGVDRAVHVGVERDVGHRVVVARDERPLVGEPARERAQRAAAAREQRLDELRVRVRAAGQ